MAIIDFFSTRLQLQNWRDKSQGVGKKRVEKVKIQVDEALVIKKK